MSEDLDRYRFDKVGRGVLLGVGHLLKFQAYIQCSLTIQSRVLGPHCSKRLANGAHVVLHHVGSNFLTAGTGVTAGLLVRKYGKYWDRFLVRQY